MRKYLLTTLGSASKYNQVTASIGCNIIYKCSPIPKLPNADQFNKYFLKAKGHIELSLEEPKSVHKYSLLWIVEDLGSLGRKVC